MPQTKTIEIVVNGTQFDWTKNDEITTQRWSRSTWRTTHSIPK